MPKNCISIYDEFSNIGPMHRTWTWGIKVKGNQILIMRSVLLNKFIYIDNSILRNYIQLKALHSFMDTRYGFVM